MSRPRIVVTRRLPKAVESAVTERFDAVLSPADAPTDAEMLQRALGEADGILCTVTDRFTAEVLAAYPKRTRILANFGVGTDNIDLEAATAHGIVVTNTPDVLTDDTADLAMMLILMAMRRASEGERELRGGRWSGWRPTHLLGHRVAGATLGIVGLGRIGQAVARRAARGFGMRVVGWGRTMPHATQLAAIGVEPMPTLPALLAEADVVSLHVPSTPGTRGMIGAPEIARMKPGAVLVNTARGDIVDEDALHAALVAGHLGGAGLDVYRGEPKVNPKLLGLERVALLPHLGSATIETREAMGMLALANLEAFFRGEVPPNRVG
jgi:lactate dehydrogenase-like 2-hydroxyacid dehydrogenase